MQTLVFVSYRTLISTKAGESRGRAPGQASDYALRGPNPLDSRAMTRCFIKISGPQTSPGPRYFAPPPLSPALISTTATCPPPQGTICDTNLGR